MYKHSPRRVAMIDNYIREYYPLKGKVIAGELGEDEQYIQQRAWYLKVRYTKKHDRAETARQTISRLRKERDEYRRQVQVLKIRLKSMERKVNERV